jgi:hypothetical protein
VCVNGFPGDPKSPVITSIGTTTIENKNIEKE